jgi:Flp pilus assembly protein TadG
VAEHWTIFYATKYNFTGDGVMRSIATLIRRFGLEERGAVLVEMTLITPLMIALSAGVFEFGNLIQKKLLVEAGLRDAARYAARCNADFSGLDCLGKAENIALTGSHDGTGSPRISDWTAAMVTVVVRDDQDAHDEATNTLIYRSVTANVRVVRAATSYPYAGTSLLSFLGIGPITLTASHEERVIGW